VRSNVRKPRWTRRKILSLCHKVDYTGDDDDEPEYEINPGYELLYDELLVVSIYPTYRMVMMANPKEGAYDVPLESWSNFRVLKEILP
jgi:hypothetical protein